MMAILHDMIEQTMEVFMDDFSVFENPFSTCLTNLEKMVKRCEDTKLALNWEKSHFMVKEGIVLGQKISKKGIKVDKEKIKDKPFELMCDASDYAVGAILGQRIEKHFQPIHNASKTMNQAEANYTTTEKEMLAVVYAFGKFRSYLIMNKSIVYTDYSSLNDRGTHFCNDQFSRVVEKYGVTHRLSTAYHPQTSGQVEVTNRGLKRILERTVGENRGSWSDTLEDALWAFRTAFKTFAYENSYIYKEGTKKLHDDKIKNRIFNVGDQVLLFNSSLKIFSGKLKSRWSGPFTISEIYPYGTAKLIHPDVCNFKVNYHRLKHYHGEDPTPLEIPDVHTFPKDN
nr:DNA-directed DNA polymerase [Tanacetum cinerariifolium]